VIGCGPVGLAVIAARRMAAARQRLREPPRRLAAAGDLLSLAGVSARLTLAAGVALLGVGLRHLGCGWTLGVAAATAAVTGTALALAAPAISRLPVRDRVIATGA
jgi:threonine dehydrogenase-like Zn-dependent dehydrogenase